MTGKADHAVTSTLLVDSHVHLHPEHRLGRVYEHAVKNFRRVDPDATGVLMLTQTARSRCSDGDYSDKPGGWVFEPTEPGLSGSVYHESFQRLTLISGFQTVTKERLEVLALGVLDPPKSDQPLQSTLAEVQAAGGFAVLPWGFGKWWGARGKHMERVLREADRGALALGDNAGRPSGYPTPSLFTLAVERGIPVLPGTDPLAIPGHAKRAGSFGFRINVPFDPYAPAQSILEALRGLRESPVVIGRRTNPIRFALDQGSIRVRKALNLGGRA